MSGALCDEECKKTQFKRFKCEQDNWPGSSPCSSHLPRPRLLQRVSLVTVKPKELKKESQDEKIPPYNFSTFELIYFVLDFAIFFQGAPTAPRTKERTSRACEKALSGFH